MHRIPIVVCLVTCVLLTGCAGSSRDQCAAWDWETVGFRDGVHGWQSTALLGHQESCAKHGIMPDRDAYLAGWQRGVEQYCQPDNGFRVGEQGGTYRNVCPARLRDGFLGAYHDGRQIHLVQVDIANLHHGIDSHAARLREVKAQLAGYAAGVLVDGATAADRAATVLAVRDLALEQGQLETELADLRRQAAAREADLVALRERLMVADAGAI